MGLLDGLNTDEGRLGMALLAAAGPQAQPMSFGQRLSGAMGNYQAGLDQREDRKAKEEERRQRAEMLMLQVQQIKQAQAEKIAAEQKAAERQRTMGSYLGSINANAGPAREFNAAEAFAAGVPAEFMQYLAPKERKPLVSKPGDIARDPVTGETLWENKAAPPKMDPNKPFSLGPNGEIIPNQAFMDYDLKARANSGVKVEVNTGKPAVPAAALKQQDDLIDRITIAKSIDADIGTMLTQITDGKLAFGPVRNLVNQGKNAAGLSDEESQNYASARSTLEKMRNDSLRLNNGVQTEGDAQRAWGELFQNLNDSAFVAKRLGEIQRINQRAAELHKYRLDVLRDNFGAPPLPDKPVKSALDAPGSSSGWGIKQLPGN